MRRYGGPPPPLLLRKAESLRFRTRVALGLGSLPNVLILGAMKAGTTSLFEYLIQHPGVCGGRTKELLFFATRYGYGTRWYRANFRPKRRHRVILEATPYYLSHPLAAKRAHETVPDAKLIVLLRNPADRAYSHYRQRCAEGVETLDFEDALAAEATRLAGTETLLTADEEAFSFEHAVYSYATRGLYAEQLQRWRRYFPPESFLFLRSEDMFARPQAVLDRVTAFLGLPAFAFPDLEPRLSRDYPPMPPWIREELETFFERPNASLEAMTGISWPAARGAPARPGALAVQPANPGDAAAMTSGAASQAEP